MKIKRLWALAVALMIVVNVTVVFASGEFVVPENSEKTEEIVQIETVTEEVDETEKKDSNFVVPSTIPKSEEREEVAKQKTSDAEYMKNLTLAFMDGIKEVFPDNPTIKFEAVMVGISEERIGSAQWFINGEPHADYYSSSFRIFNGRRTEFEITFPFERNTQNSQVTISFELHLNGVVRKIEKVVSLTNYGEEYYDTRVLNMIKPVEIEATLRNWTYTYTNKYLGTTNGSLDKGAKVIYMDHYGTTGANIWIPEENRGCWVPYSALSISAENYTVAEDFTDEEKESFVNAKGYESNTEYLIWVNLERQRVNLFKGTKGNWDLIRVSTCSSGTNLTPTPTGVVKYCGYSNGWFHSTYYVKPVMYINLERGIALHSILYNPNGTVQDGTQGTPASHGCVRMPGDQISWFAENVPMYTTVVVF